ncbi:MAG: potassium channel family protein [Hydrogenophaga sp.]|uniref:potassium channel family protein n=1 Tax=Hydrogenophaga taeniospiralis TaxID=65656 RepID=UPI001CFB8F79|nr:potassium channel family protein [Hydrogenophaga taeniospiralis]MDO9291664.1 potassium channel family protein [Hydrogenophaga sp.]UCU93753.1 two pore domain potassium channel family protein [Hydrogenophaga taeniospiralis]
MKRSRQRRLHIMRRGLWYSLALCLWILLIGGVGFWLLEPGIDTLQDGLWLAFTTAATVGYGDMVPRTPAGRAFAVLVVLLGLAVLSLVTASLAAIFVEQEVQDEVVAGERQIEHELIHEIRALRAQVQGLQDRMEHSSPTPDKPQNQQVRP